MVAVACLAACGIHHSKPDESQVLCLRFCIRLPVLDERQPDFKALCRKAVSAFAVIVFGFFLCVDFGQDAVDFFGVAVDAVASV